MTVNIAQLRERGPNFIHIKASINETTRGHSLYVARTLNDAYGAVNGVAAPSGSLLIGTAEQKSGGLFSSPARKGQYIVHPGRPLSYFDYDPSDYDSTAGYPSADGVAFLRLTVPGGPVPTGGGPITMAPPFGWRSVGRPALSLFGTAPQIATATPGDPPPTDAMHLKFPAYADSLRVTNHGAVDLFLAVGEGLPMMRVSAGEVLNHNSGMSDNLFLCSAAGNPDFSLLVGIVQGER